MASQSNEADLLSRAVRGDVDAGCKLLGKYLPALRGQISGRIPKRFQSVLSEDDVLQQTCADALVSFGRFENRGEGSLNAWLSSLARCNLLDAVKALKTEKRGGNRRRVEVVDQSYVDLCDLLAGPESTPSRIASREEICRAIMDVLKRLPADYQKVVTLYDLKGQDIDSVSAELKRSKGAVFMLRARAHDRLRDILGSGTQFFTSS